MIILSFDTSGPSGSAALLDEETVLSETNWRATSSHTTELPLRVEQILRESGLILSGVEAFGVTIGPGSFTGIRVGLAFAKGLALAGKKPVIGVSTLRSLALKSPEDGFLCPWLDARREEIYGALFEKRKGELTTVLEEGAKSPDVFLREIRERLGTDPSGLRFFGDGARFYREKILEVFGDKNSILNDYFDTIQARDVGREAYRLFLKGEFSPGGIHLNPHYLRASEAEIKHQGIKSGI